MPLFYHSCSLEMFGGASNSPGDGVALMEYNSNQLFMRRREIT